MYDIHVQGVRRIQPHHRISLAEMRFGWVQARDSTYCYAKIRLHHAPYVTTQMRSQTVSD